MTLDVWVGSHAFLRPLANLHAQLEAAVAAAAPPEPALPEWRTYESEFDGGVPLLASTGAAIDLGAIDAAGDRAIEALNGHAPDDPGLRECVAWMARSAALRPVVDAFAAWRDDTRWMRPYCPLCGSAPAMAQLTGIEPGRLRHLVCGHCATRWRYGRTTCPFCETESSRLSSLAAEGECGLRIDYCETCRAYLKTYNGQGHEAVLLADWTSLHLDLAACERGWRRAAGSLYSFDTNDPAAPPAYRSDSDDSGLPATAGGLTRGLLRD
jgi:FdhE protein